jgi:hypothetical protein
MFAQNKALTWTGRVLSGLVCLMLTFSAIMKFKNGPDIAEMFVGKLGYPADVTFPIGVVELACVILYAIPQTSILGAILLTGYLGGAIATHVRVHDDFIMVVVVGIVVWLALFLREPRLRALIPLRTSVPQTEQPSK